MKQKRYKRRVEAELDYKEYFNKLDKKDKAWVKKFYNEFYEAPLLEDREIMNDPEMIKEANRTHNALYKDALNIAEKTDGLRELAGTEQEFMEDASDEWEWRNIYKTQGYECAILQIFYQAERDLKNKNLDIRTSLARFLNKYLAIKKLSNRRDP